MKHAVITFSFLLLLQPCLWSQHLTGTWEGQGGGSEYCKLVIVQLGDSVFGFTYDTGMGYCKCNFAGTYNDSSKKLNGKNTSVIEKTFLHSMSAYQLSYSKQGEKEYLKGKAGPKSTGGKILSFGLTAPVSYTKITSEIDTTIFIAAKLAYYNQPPAAIIPAQQDATVTTTAADTDTVEATSSAAVPDLKTIKESRKSELVKAFQTKEDSVKLVLYDNGDIDGDTVTVFFNGAIIINRLGLSARPFEMTIPIAKTGTPQVIELVANNLGSIPPNTAYMQVWEKDKRHELRLSSDFNTNARIDISFKPD